MAEIKVLALRTVSLKPLGMLFLSLLLMLSIFFLNKVIMHSQSNFILFSFTQYFFGKHKILPYSKVLRTRSVYRFLRSVSYREFSRMVYGVLGTKRIPLPACAFTAIRKQFPPSKDEELTGFEKDDES
jgi:hypothetical protein